MSILIKGMEMPKTCSECPMCDRMDRFCHVARRWLDDDEYWTWYVYPEGEMDDSKPCNCPLVEVPTPHGDLIDREAFLAEKRHLYCENCERRKGMKNGKMKFVYDIGDAPCRACGYGDVLDDIEDAPTIIESEGE